LKNQRNENDFRDIYKKAQKFAIEFNIDIKIPRIANKQCNRSNIPSQSSGLESYYRIFIYYSYIDFITTEMEYTFSAKIIK